MNLNIRNISHSSQYSQEESDNKYNLILVK